MEEQEILIDAPLSADPDELQEMAVNDAEAIADEDLKGSRLLLVRRAAETIDLEGKSGGAVELVCTFQPAEGARFTWARILLLLTSPEGVHILDLAPRETREDEPVRFVVDGKGKLSLKYHIVEAGVERGVKKEFAIYHCAVQGSGESTSLARWEFKENPYRKDGLGPEQSLALTLPITGRVSGSVTVNARLARVGLRARIESIRDLVLGPKPGEKSYPIGFEIPVAPPGGTLFSRFFPQ